MERSFQKSQALLHTVEPSDKYPNQPLTNHSWTSWTFGTWRSIENLFWTSHLFNLSYQVTSLESTYRILEAKFMRAWLFHHGEVKQAKRIKLRSHRSAVLPAAVMGSLRMLSNVAKIKFPPAIMLLLVLVGSADALDNDIALQPYSGANMTAPETGLRIPIGLVGTYVLVAAGLLTTTATSLLGPLMGISSVLWFIMRNDAAIKPSVSWA